MAELSEQELMTRDKEYPRIRFDIDDYLRWMIFAPHGVGKTTFLGTGVDDPRLWPGLILDFEGGVKSIRSKVQRVEKAGDLYKGLVRPEKGKFLSYKPKSWAQVEDIVAFLNDPMGERYHWYQSVYVDSLTEMNQVNLTEVVDKAIQAKPTRKSIVPEIADYGASRAQIRLLLRTFRDLPIHSFYTCLAQKGEDPVTGVEVIPTLVGQLAGELPGLVDIVSYMKVDLNKRDREMIFQPTSSLRTKARDEEGKLGESKINCTIPWVLDQLYGPI